MAQSKQDYLIVQIPYGTHQAERTPEINNEEEYRTYCETVVESDSPEIIKQHYIHPRHPRRGDVRLNFQRLTGWPVVYLVCFKQTEKMNKSNWLMRVLGKRADKRKDLYDSDFVVYVGETNDIVRRTNQHLTVGKRKRRGDLESEETYEDILAEVDERTAADRVIQAAALRGDTQVSQYVIWNEYFTKSMTLDIEHKFIDYIFSLDNVFKLNGRGNPQRNYFMSEEKDAVCSRVWQTLSLANEELFPPEHDIWNSELFKVSPFHALGEEQSNAVNEICDNVLKLLAGEPICGETLAEATSPHRLIVVEGASGTGKSIVLSTLFLRLSQALNESRETGVVPEPNSKVCLVVNQDQQLTLYKNLASKVGLMRSEGDKDSCVFKATPYLNLVTKKRREPADVVLIDEAHLLRMETHRSYGKQYHGNQLYDILLNARVVIAVLDPIQIMRKSQQWPEGEIAALLPDESSNNNGNIAYSGAVALKSHGANYVQGEDTFNAYRVTLTEQFRMDAGEEVIDWIDRLADTQAEGRPPVPSDTKKHAKAAFGPYEIKVFGSPVALAAALSEKRCEVREKIKREKGGTQLGSPLCRMVATYD